jgi:hypothetical protein
MKKNNMIELQDCEITSDDKPAIEIFSNSCVDIKVKINVVSDENGDPLPDQVVVDTAHELLQAVIAVLSENVSDQTLSQPEEDRTQITVTVFRSTE